MRARAFGLWIVTCARVQRARARAPTIARASVCSVRRREDGGRKQHKEEQSDCVRGALASMKKRTHQACVRSQSDKSQHTLLFRTRILMLNARLTARDSFTGLSQVHLPDAPSSPASLRYPNLEHYETECKA
eukprot:4722491-Pleurochrysis_carterae.AAC.2